LFDKKRTSVGASFQSGAGLPRRYSLRWRLPFFVCIVITAVLAASLAAAYRVVETTLLSAGGVSAQNAASQVANLLAPAAARAVEQMQRSADDPAVKSFLRNPTDSAREAVRKSLAELSQAGPRRLELWNDSGDRLLEVAIPASEGAPRALPPAERPSRPGLLPLKVSEEFTLADVVVEVKGEPADADPSYPLGYLLLRSYLSVNPPGLMSRLVGPDALVSVGNRSGGAWTDFSGPVSGPLVDLSRDEVAEYVGSDGQSRIGALVGVSGTPWVVWVEFRKARLLAPARAFLRRMVSLSIVFVGVGALLVTNLTHRVTTPLGDLSRAAEEIAAGDYSRRVPGGRRRDEVGRLSSAFNVMALKVDEAYRALKEAHEHTQFALAAARIGVWELDLASGRIQWSESMSFVHGVPASAFEGTPAAFLTLVHPDDRDSMAKLVAGKIPATEFFDLAFRSLWPDASVHWIEGKGRIMRAESGEPTSILAASIDVTERRLLQAQLNQSQKMEAIGQLAGGVAHDFNNLLTAILGYGNMILERAEDQNLRNDVLEILRAGESAAALTRQLLAFSRRQVMQPTVVSLKEVVASVEKMLRRLIGENIDLVIVFHEGPETVRADPNQLEQVIINLAVNARDAMPGGGRLTIETSTIDLDDLYCREHPSVTPGPHILLSVSDTGTGMEAETQARLFEPFFTTKEQGRGTGLGLATVYGIVKQSGGHIYVYSEPGRGTTFKIYLPSVAETGAVAKRKPATSELIGGEETVLVVEDNQAARELATKVLERLGYSVLTASSGGEALRLLEEKRAPVNLLVSDVVMPGMTGPELAERVLAARPQTKVLYTSGYSDDAIGRHGVLSPGAIFMQKPYTPALQARNVREALRG
jgi:signal transduction histidine kinase